MQPSENIKKLIKGWEGLRLKAYLCPAGVPTIGYGHTGGGIHPGQKCTRAEADKWFEQDAAVHAASLNSLLLTCRHALAQNRFDALFSFAFNLGVGNLKGSTLWRKVCSDPSDITIPAEFQKWVFAAGKKLSGLEERRRKEGAIYSGAPY